MGNSQVLVGSVILTNTIHEDAAVVLDGEKIAWVGKRVDLPEQYSTLEVTTVAAGGYIAPGFVDVHSHGGGGASFPDATTIEDVQVAADEHLSHGTTTLVASLVTAAIPVLEERAALLADAVEAGIIIGIHYEGPFLSKARCGAQNPKYLVPATPADAQKLVDAARGYAVSITLAPEHCLDEDGRAAVEILINGGILPSWGHSDCTTAQANEAVDMGEALLDATPQKIRGGLGTVTHLFNGMPPMHHREPGPIPALMAAASEGRLIAELISDGVHLDPALVTEVLNLVGRDNLVFVTDAMAAAGMEDGEYVLGPNAVTVLDGVARLTDGGNLAGGTSRLADQVKTAVQQGGVPLVDAIFLAAKQGAKVLGLTDRGEIAAGKRADVVVLTEDLDVQQVYRAGQLVI